MPVYSNEYTRLTAIGSWATRAGEFAMNADRGENAKVWVVSIHDKTPRGDLDFDVHEILRCLGRTVHEYAWLITELDCTGQEAQSLCDAVASRRGRGKSLRGVRIWSGQAAEEGRCDRGRAIQGPLMRELERVRVIGRRPRRGLRTGVKKS